MKTCPKCGSSSLSDCLATGRKLQQRCNECYWKGELRTPKRRRIETTKLVAVDHFGGIIYETFDKYGQPITHSETFRNEAQAKKEMMKELEQGLKDEDGGPYTGIIWPAEVKATGKKFFLRYEGEVKKAKTAAK